MCRSVGQQQRTQSNQPRWRLNSFDTAMEDDDVTIVAETTTTKMDFIEAEMTDLNLRYEIPYRKGSKDDNDYELHIQLLIALTTAFNKMTLRIYDNQNQRVKSFSDAKWQNKDYYDTHFNTHEDISQRKTVIVHRVMSKKTISVLKNDPNTIKHLKRSTTYLRAHFWKDNEVLLKDIGFLVSYIPT
jgi:hypothetical protein